MTQRALNVRTFCSVVASQRHRLTLATLPLSFNIDHEGPVDIALAGPDEDSIGHAVASQPKVIVLDQPASTAPKSLQKLLATGLTVLPVLEVAPILSPLRSVLPLAEVVLVRSCLSSSAGAQGGRLEHILALQAVLGPLVDITVFKNTGDFYSASARPQSTTARVFWNGQTGADQDRFDLDILSLTQRLEVNVTYSPTAKPAKVCLADRDGSREFRSVYQSGLHLFWRAVALETTGHSSNTIYMDGEVVHLVDISQRS